MIEKFEECRECEHRGGRTCWDCKTGELFDFAGSCGLNLDEIDGEEYDSEDDSER